MDIGWGQLWEAIGKTFETGGKVHTALIGEREQKAALAFGREQLDQQGYTDKMALLQISAGEEAKLIRLAIIAAVILIIVVLWIKK